MKRWKSIFFMKIISFLVCAFCICAVILCVTGTLLHLENTSRGELGERCYENSVFQEIADRGNIVNSDVYAAHLYQMTENNASYFVPGIVIFSLLALVAFCVLMMCCGHRKEGTIENNWLDRMPFLLPLFLLISVASGCITLTISLFEYEMSLKLAVLMLVISMVVSVLCTLLLCMTISTRWKTKTLFTNTITYRIIKLILKPFTMLGRLMSGFQLIWKWVFVFSVYVILSFLFAIALHDSELAWFFYILVQLAGFFVLGYEATQMTLILKGIKNVANGTIDTKLSTYGLHGASLQHIEYLNQIMDNIKDAVEKEMKSERMKTELITNVSHDLKTPLTSLINYVDLLDKELENTERSEQVTEYVEVLKRQSAKLKKLVEDLVEASKASSGNMTINTETICVNELLGQVLAEYDIRFHDAGLQTIVNAPEKPVLIAADGKLIWRILDNLFGNCCKYAQQNTRVYVTVTEMTPRVCIRIKNISREMLNVSPEELMERFVRGESSRHTEGSGLGLSIARSLTELMNGRFLLQTDGDVFCVELTFPTVIQTEERTEVR